MEEVWNVECGKFSGKDTILLVRIKFVVNYLDCVVTGTVTVCVLNLGYRC